MRDNGLAFRSLRLGRMGAMRAGVVIPPVVTMSRAILTQNIIDAHQTDADTNFQGWTSTTGFTVFTETTPDAVRTRIETWRAAPAGLIKIICDWDGILDLTSASLRGPGTGVLTVDAGSLDGYVRPAGGVWLEAAAGKLPVFGNSSIDVFGMPRIFFDGIGFAGKANGLNGDNITNVNMRTTGTFPLYVCAAFKRCIFGLTVHRPSEPATEYIKPLGAAYGFSLHIESCQFAGVRDAIRARAKYVRVWKNHVRKNLSDFITHFGFTDANWTGQRVWAWIEGNVVTDLVDQAGFNGLHTDFYQTGTALDVHEGNSALVRWNVAHMKTSISANSGTQFVYMDDHLTAANSLVCHDNIAAISAYNIAQLFDPSGTGHFFVEDNTGMRAGDYENGPDPYPRVNISSLGTPTTAGGTVSVSRNYLTLIANIPAITLTQTGNYYIDPRNNVVSGDGSSQPLAKRPEAVFSASFLRNGVDKLTYSILGSDSADYATAFWAIADFFMPTAGWAVQAGANNPTTWAAAPARPVGNRAPENTTAPLITGTAASGSTLTGSNGTWLGTPTPTFTYQWRRDGVNIAGATAITYPLVSADIGTITTLVVTATNIVSAVSATSNALGPVISPAVAPANTVLPVISGTPTQTQTLLCSTGTWTGTATITYAYQWCRNGVDIAGATSASYLLVPADVATTTTCRVTATNGGGSVSATSAGVGPVAAFYSASFQSVNSEGWSTTYASPPTFNPSGAPQYATVERLGFGPDGLARYALEDLICTQRVRQAYPNQASLSADRVAMSDYIYSTDFVSGVTNNSAQTSPKPIAGWALADRTVVGNTLVTDIVAFHRNARDREQIAAVEFSATDGTTTVSQFVTTSIIAARAGDQLPVIVYRSSLDISTLANPATITVNAKVYPHIGGSSSILDSAAVTPRRGFSPRFYRRDTALLAAPVFAYVSTTGNDTTGAVSTTAATAEATPCATIAGAINRLVAVNGRVDGCLIRCMAGSHAFSSTASTRTQDYAELIVTRDPNAARSAVTVTAGASGPRLRLGAAGGWLTIQDLTYTRTGTSGWIGEAASQLEVRFTDLDFNNALQNATVFGTNSQGGFIACTFTNVSSSLLNAGAREIRIIRGCTGATTSAVEGWLFLGNSMTVGAVLTYGTRSASGSICAYSRIQSDGGMFNIGQAENITSAALVGCVLEYTGVGSNSAAGASRDDATGSTEHVVIHHNTFAGFYIYGRGNLFYDEGATARSNKLMSVRGNIHVQINTKGDVFVLDGARVGNWAYLYGVGCQGEFSQFIDATNGGIGSAFAQAYPGLNASIGTSSTTRNDPLFVTYAGTTSGPTAGAGGGNYALQSGSPAKARATAVLRFDAAGATRTALSSAGAYQ